MHTRNCAGFALAASYWQLPEDEPEGPDGEAVEWSQEATAARAALAVRCTRLRVSSPRRHRAG